MTTDLLDSVFHVICDNEGGRLGRPDFANSHLVHSSFPVLRVHFLLQGMRREWSPKEASFAGIHSRPLLSSHLCCPVSPMVLAKTFPYSLGPIWWASGQAVPQEDMGIQKVPEARVGLCCMTPSPVPVLLQRPGSHLNAGMGLRVLSLSVCPSLCPPSVEVAWVKQNSWHLTPGSPALVRWP